MPNQFAISVMPKDPDSWMSLARTLDGFLFDVASIKSVEIRPDGRSFNFTYTRLGKTLTPAPLLVSAEEFRAAAEQCASRDDFGKTSIAEKLFASGAAAFVQSERFPAADDMKDMSFIDELAK